jgi:hypothetical protein
MYALLQEAMPDDNSFWLRPAITQSLTILAFQGRLAITFTHDVIDTLGIAADVERLQFRPLHYYALAMTTNPLLSEGEINYLSAAIFMFKEFGLHQLSDLMESFIYFPLPNPGIIRILRLLGVLNYRNNGGCAADIQSPKVQDEINLCLDFHRQHYAKPLVEKRKLAHDFLTRYPNILTRVVNSENYHPRRPNAVISFDEGFGDLFNSEYSEIFGEMRRQRWKASCSKDLSRSLSVTSLSDISSSSSSSTHRVADSI